MDKAKSKDTVERDREDSKVRRYDRWAWILFTLPTIVVLFLVFARSCGGGET